MKCHHKYILPDRTNPKLGLKSVFKIPLDSFKARKYFQNSLLFTEREQVNYFCRPMIIIYIFIVELLEKLKNK